MNMIGAAQLVCAGSTDINANAFSISISPKPPSLGLASYSTQCIVSASLGTKLILWFPRYPSKMTVSHSLQFKQQREMYSQYFSNGCAHWIPMGVSSFQLLRFLLSLSNFNGHMMANLCFEMSSRVVNCQDFASSPYHLSFLGSVSFAGLVMSSLLK